MSSIGTIQRQVKWLHVAGAWTRVSVMGSNLPIGILSRQSNAHQSVEHIPKMQTNIILMIPGNPGNEGFYDYFGRRLLEKLNSKSVNRATSDDDGGGYLFYTISHMNHVQTPIDLDIDKQNDRYLLPTQIRHKLDFCLEYLPRTSKMHIFGHSIGAYMMLRIIPDLIAYGFHVSLACSLFPTIERMSDSPNGRRLRHLLAFVDRYDLLTRILFCWLDWLPNSIKHWLCRYHLGAQTPASIVDSAAELLQLNVLRNIIHLSNDELNSVCEFDDSLLLFGSAIADNKLTIGFYYGTDDGWCPLEYANQMEQRLRDGDCANLDIDRHVIIDNAGCQHAFVIRDSDTIADKLVELYFE